MAAKPATPVTPDPVETIFREFAVAMVVNAQTAALRLGIQLFDVEAVNLLGIHGPMTAGDLANRLSLPTATATRVIDRLESAGFVRRARDTRDRRKVIVEPVPEHLTAADAVFAPTSDRLNGLRDKVSARQLEGFLRVLAMATDELREATVEMREAR